MKNASQNHNYTFDAASPKRVSYVLVTKNRSAFLAKALVVARDLKGPEDELIIIDGGSTDDTMRLVNQNKDLIDVFVSEPDNSSHHASNKGIMLACGKYVHQFADDDITYRAGMEKTVEVLDRHPEVDMLVCGGMRQMGPNLLPYWLPPGTNYGSQPEDAFRYNACGAGFVYRRRAFAKFGLYDSVAADIEFVAKVVFHGGVVKFCRINLFHHEMFGHSMVISKKRAHQLARWRIAWRYCSFWFALRYITRSIVKESFFWRFYRRARKFLRVRILGKPYKKEKKEIDDFMWDGGFS